MKEIKLDQISKEAGVSKTTASRALNNCGHVSGEAREAVIKAAKKYGYETKNQKKNKGKRVGVITPVKPSYFWGQALQGLYETLQPEESLEYSCVYGHYSSLETPEDFLLCLENILRLDPDILVLVAMDSPAVKERLTEIAEEKTLFFLNEGPRLPNGYYIGMDAYRDGRLLAEGCLEPLKKSKGILTVGVRTPCERVSLRAKGFFDAIREKLPDLPDMGRAEVRESPSASAELAREIKRNAAGEFDFVYVESGFLPRACEALRKLGLLGNVICAGYENPKQNEDFLEKGAIFAVVEQDIRRQGMICGEAVLEYLRGGQTEKEKTVPSKLYRHC